MADTSDIEAYGDLFEVLYAALPIEVAVFRAADGAFVFANTAMRHRLDPAALAFEEMAHDYVRSDLRLGADSFTVVTARNREPGDAADELARRAFYDDLTGLPKTQLAQASVNAMIEEGPGEFAVAFVDLDNFKFVNDCYGHGVGDRLLVKVADRMSETIRDTDILARVGGDEFVVVLYPMPPGEAVAAAERLAARLREPFSIDGFEIFASASIGLSLHPLDGGDYDTLRAKADMAMYGVKNSGKGEVGLFDIALSRAANRRMENEQRLRLAMRDGRIECAYQAKVDFRRDLIVGVEVLMRWRDEDGTVHPPGELIALAIELALVDELTMIILGRVAAEIDRIDEAFGATTSISLNVAASQATNVAFMERLAAAIAAAGLPDRMILELTEEALLAADTFTKNVLPMLRARGIRISIDDFGAGYSSLSALAELEADELKIDRSFITDIHAKPRNQAIVKVIDGLAATLDIKVVVEGVESYEELAYLMAETRIAHAQGYYFAKPVSLAEVDDVRAGVTPPLAGRGRTTRGVRSRR